MAATEGPRADDPAPARDPLRNHRHGRGHAHHIASLDALMRRAEERSLANGVSVDEAAAVIVEELEVAVTALNRRVAPLVSGCGILVAVAGLVLKVEPSSQGVAESFIGLAVLFAIGGMWLLTSALFTYAGRQAIGLAPTVEDIAFAHDRLVRKHRSAHWGGWLAGVSLTSLIIGILLGVHIGISAG